MQSMEQVWECLEYHIGQLERSKFSGYDDCRMLQDKMDIPNTGNK